MSNLSVFGWRKLGVPEVNILANPLAKLLAGTLTQKAADAVVKGLDEDSWYALQTAVETRKANDYKKASAAQL